MQRKLRGCEDRSLLGCRHELKPMVAGILECLLLVIEDEVLFEILGRFGLGGAKRFQKREDVCFHLLII